MILTKFYPLFIIVSNIFRIFAKKDDMLVNVLKSKIHRVTVTEADLDYIGSITIDEELMEAAGIIENEQVDIYTITHGERFHTYAIRGTRGMYSEESNYIYLDTDFTEHDHFNWEKNWNNAKEYLKKYEHPVWVKYKTEGVRGGLNMDFVYRVLNREV